MRGRICAKVSQAPVEQQADRFRERFFSLCGEFGELREFIVSNWNRNDVPGPVKIGHFHFAHVHIICGIVCEQPLRYFLFALPWRHFFIYSVSHIFSVPVH
jgi:hypothetical protein